MLVLIPGRIRGKRDWAPQTISTNKQDEVPNHWKLVEQVARHQNWLFTGKPKITVRRASQRLLSIPLPYMGYRFNAEDLRN